MIRNIIKIAWRNFYKRKFYSAINVFGLSLGICCVLMLYLFISYHLSFDTYHANAKRLYRAVTDLHLGNNGVEYDQGTPYILGSLLKQVPEVENTTALLEKRTFTVSVANDNHTGADLFNEFEDCAFTDNNWFSLFTYRWKAGDPQTALSKPFSAVITAKLARKYFNNEDVVGHTITLDSKFLLTITGVLADNPPNTDIQDNLFLSVSSLSRMYPESELRDFWNDIGFISSKNHVYALLKEGASVNQANEAIHKITQKPLAKYGGAYQFHLQHLTDVHFDSRYSGTISKTLLSVLILVSLAIIAIASVNFVNLSIAQSFTRIREIGTRKVLGGSRSVIFWQFIAETAFAGITASIVATGALLLILPTLQNWLQIPLEIHPHMVVFLVFLLIAVIFAAGFYPAVIISGFKPVSALKNLVSANRKSSQGSRNTLIIVQNTVAQVLIVSTIIISLQVKFLKNADLGFNKDAVIMVPLPENVQLQLPYLSNELRHSNSIKNVSFCYRAPVSTTNKGGMVRLDSHDWEKFPVRSVIADDHYTSAFGLKIIAGRNLTATDTGAHAFLVNQALLSKLGIHKPEQALGHQLTTGDFSDKPGVIVGVVKDFHTHSLYTELEPAVIASKAELYQYAAIKVSPYNQREAVEGIKATWQKIFPQHVFEYRFLDEQIADLYRKDEMISRLIRVGSVVAIIISCLGMLGLISLTTVQRTKEIGIHKVLGASVTSIVNMLTKDFIRLLAIAIFISLPIGWWVMHRWLLNFAYRINISWWMFGLAALSALLLAAITVCTQSIRAALANPARSIRNE